MAREQFVVDRRQIRVTWPLLLIVVGALACLLDAFTTWAALHRQSHFNEQSPTTANLIAALGLTGGLAISVLLRVAIFSGVAVAMERLPKTLEAAVCDRAARRGGDMAHRAREHQHARCLLAAGDPRPGGPPGHAPHARYPGLDGLRSVARPVPRRDLDRKETRAEAAPQHAGLCTRLCGRAIFRVIPSRSFVQGVPAATRRA